MLFKFVGGCADGQELDVPIGRDGLPLESFRVPDIKASGLNPEPSIDIYEYRRKQYVDPANNSSWFEYHF